VQLILDGSYQNPTIGSSEGSQEEGRISMIFPQTSGEFIYVCDTLESPDNKNIGQMEVLLQAIHNFIWRCQEYQKKGTLFPPQSVCFAVAKPGLGTYAQVQYNPSTGKMELDGLTKAELRNRQITCFSTTRAEGHWKMPLERWNT